MFSSDACCFRNGELTQLNDEEGWEKQNILYRPKRLKKLMQTRMKTKKKLLEIQPLTLVYTIFHEEGTPFVYLLSVTNSAPSTYLVPVCRAWQEHARAFFKKAFCTHQNRSIARGSVGPTKSFAPAFQGSSCDIFWQIYPHLSVLLLSTSLVYAFSFLSVW